MTPLRVLITADAIGGVWRYAIDLAAGLGPLGIDAVVATLGPSTSAAQRAEAAAVRGLRLIETGLPLDWLASEDAVRANGAAIATLAHAEQVDLVHLNTAALASAAYDMPVIVGGHGCLASWWACTRGAPLPQDLGWHGTLTRAGLMAADRVVAPSMSFAGILRDVYALPFTPDAVPNGARFPGVAPLRPAAHAFTAGRLWDQAKNAELLDRIAAGLSVPLRAAGRTEGPRGERTSTAHLTLLGMLDADGMAAELGQRPVFISAARFEPFGLAVLEAAAAGCPLVLADIPTFRELWDGAASFAALDDPGAFVAATELLLADSGRRRVAGDAARRRAARYTPERTAVGTAALYRDLLNEGVAPGGRAAA